MDQQNKNKPAKMYFVEYTPENCDASLPPILFIHGIYSLHNSWSTVWKQVADETERKAICLELRNHGQSEYNDHFSLELLILDLEHFVTENGIKRCVLIGHSLGGRIALYFTLKRPELVECVVSEESPLQNPSDEQQVLVKTFVSFARRVKLLPKSMSILQVRRMMRDTIAAKYPGNAIASLAYYIPLRKTQDGSIDFDYNFDALTRSLEDITNLQTDPKKYGKYDGRALFIYAQNSETKLDEDKLIPEKFPNAELCQFNSAAHVLHMDCSQEYIKKVSTFIRS